MIFSVVSSFFNGLYQRWNNSNAISVLHPIALTFHVKRDAVMGNPVGDDCCNRIVAVNIPSLSI